MKLAKLSKNNMIYFLDKTVDNLTLTDAMGIEYFKFNARSAIKSKDFLADLLDSGFTLITKY